MVLSKLELSGLMKVKLVVPTNLEIQSGDTATLLFKIDYEAPAGGVVVDVKTNVPLSVIMPEALIAEGVRQ